MAQLLIDKKIKNQVWSITFSVVLTKLSEKDKELMDAFGEPTINAGGSFGTNPNDYTLPDKFIRVISDFPFTQNFDEKSPTFASNTAVKAGSFETSFLTKYDDAFTTLRASDDSFEKQELHTI